MEFTFKIRTSILGFKLDSEIYFIPGKQLPQIERHTKRTNQKVLENFQTLINRLGNSSAKAQRLSKTITSYDKTRNSDHNIYLLVDPKNPWNCLGFIRVGRKHLFLIDRYSKQHEVEPLSVLDFYVHESCQRKGFGLKLFKSMMKNECVKHPNELAIDKPSGKFMGFLRKHYKLTGEVPQMNNYVVFDGFFGKENIGSVKYPKRSTFGYSARVPERDLNEIAAFNSNSTISVTSYKHEQANYEKQENIDTLNTEKIRLKSTRFEPDKTVSNFHAPHNVQIPVNRTLNSNQYVNNSVNHPVTSPDNYAQKSTRDPKHLNHPSKFNYAIEEDAVNFNPRISKSAGNLRFQESKKSLPPFYISIDTNNNKVSIFILGF